LQGRDVERNEMKTTIDMAREAGFNLEQGFLLRVTGIDEDLKRFESLVRADEREACAKVADYYASGMDRNYSEIIADAIRNRGNT
jgi:hypothetical protein